MSLGLDKKKNSKNFWFGLVGAVLLFMTIWFGFASQPEVSDNNFVSSKSKIVSNRRPASTELHKSKVRSIESQSESRIYITSKKEKEEELAKHRAFRKQIDECDERIKKQRESDADFMKRFRPKLEEKIGSWFFDSEYANVLPKNERTTEAKFLLGLAYAGMLRDIPEQLVKTDYERALAILDEVRSLVPKNSAPVLFQSAIQKKRGHEDLAKKLKQIAFTTAYFDAYENYIKTAFWELVDTPSDLSNSFNYWAYAPNPEFNVLKELINSPEDVFFADQMLKASMNPQNVFEGYDWGLLQHNYGRMFHRQLTGKDEIPHFMDIIKTKMKSVGKQWVDSADSTQDYLRSCDLSYLEDSVAELKLYREKKQIH